jgi:hypothetical protein
VAAVAFGCPTATSTTGVAACDVTGAGARVFFEVEPGMTPAITPTATTLKKIADVAAMATVGLTLLLCCLLL